MAEHIIIKAVVDVTLSKAIPLVKKMINLQQDFKDELNKLDKSLTITHAFLRDAGRRKVHDEAVQFWLKELRKIASEADDVLDELSYEDLRSMVETQLTKKVRNFFSISKNPFMFFSNTLQTVKGINKSLDEINDQALKFGLQQRVHTLPPSSGGCPPTYSFVRSSHVVGREADVSKIIDLLIESSTQQAFSITSIVGRGGLGKTTLAKLVCKNERTKNYFDKVMWVCVSENFDVRSILQEMIESLTGKKCHVKNRSTMLEKIQNKLKGKTYLLTLDDVCNVDIRNWQELKESLLAINDNIQCSILVTTRNENAPMVKGAPKENMYCPLPLEKDECWAIIKNIAFQNLSVSPQLENIGREIAGKCRGIPFMANVIGGAMNKNRDIDEWVVLRDNFCSGSLKKEIVDVLKLNFDCLPSSSLKLCFAYCSIFPKNFTMKKEKLIQLWMAEGFLQQTEEKTFEDIGNEYFNDLLSNSLLEDVEKDICGSVTSCKMHDFVHDFAQSISYAETGNASHNETKNEFDSVKLWHSLFSKSSFFFIEADFKGLRVLNFCGSDISDLSESIDMLKHLRYFDLSKTLLYRLPKSITKLYHLQTIRLLKCHYLEKLPLGMKNLVSLRHFYVDNPQHTFEEIGCVTNLRTLPIFDLGTESNKIEELRCLKELGGKLKIYNLQNIRNKKEARRAKIWEKKNLHTLRYEWDDEREDCSKDEKVLEGLEPHSNLKSLTIKNYYGDKNPSWLERKKVTASFLLINLVELKLSNCTELKKLPTLGEYPNLKFIEIRGLSSVKCIEKKFYMNDSGDENSTLFPALEKFTISGLHKVKKWLDAEATIDVFPSLRELQIEECDNLSSVPVMKRLSSLEILTIRKCKQISMSDGGLSECTRLQNLCIEECPNLISIPSVYGFSCLLTLTLSECKGLTSLPSGLRSCASLQKFYIDECNNLESIPKSVGRLHSLRDLTITYCQNLKKFPEESLGFLTRLKTLALGPFSEELEDFPGLSSIGYLSSSLKDLTLFGWNELSSLPDQIQHLTSLRVLRIARFSGVEILPKWLRSFSSLKKLYIMKCENLRHLPSKETMEDLHNLQEISIWNCPRLKQNRKELSRISHVPKVSWDDE